MTNTAVQERPAANGRRPAQNGGPAADAVPVLRTRKPTKRAGWPRVLIEGNQGSGKSWSIAEFSASDKIGRTVIIVLGEDESRWNEYGNIDGARFELAEHTGSWKSILDAVRAARAEAAAGVERGDKPFVLAIDTITAEWDFLKDWTGIRARNSRKNKALLAQDPDAEIEVTANFWNDAKARHRALMRELLLFPGIVLLVARGAEVTMFQNGQPVIGRTSWSVDAEKTVVFDVSAHVRLSFEAQPLLIKAAGVHCQIRPGIDPPRRLGKWSLEDLVFGLLKLDAGNTAVSGLGEMKHQRTAEQIRDDVLDKRSDPQKLLELWHETAESNQLDIETENETGDQETLRSMITRIGVERGAQPKAA